MGLNTITDAGFSLVMMLKGEVKGENFRATKSQGCGDETRHSSAKEGQPKSDGYPCPMTKFVVLRILLRF